MSIINTVNLEVELGQVVDTTDHMVRFNSMLEGEVNIGLVACLKKNKDVFS